MVTDQNGSVVARHDYLPFGVEIPAGVAGRPGVGGATDGLSPKFTGQDHDTETFLEFYQARYPNVGANSPLLDLQYTYGGGSQSSANPTQIAIKTAAVPSATQTSYAQSFAYDSANRLCLAAEGITVSSCSSAVSGNTWAQQSGYDRYGNMSGTSTGPSGIPALPAAGSYNTSNQLTSGGVGYDFAGNQTAIGSSSLSYDAENRQTVDHDTVSGNYTNYGYDGMGERVTKALTGGASTVYVHDAFGNLAAEYTTGGATTMACTTCYLSWDHLGSTRMVTDQNGAVVPYGRHDYLPFGYEIPGGIGVRTAGVWGGVGGQTDNVSAKFTGAERDAETGFDFLQARYQASLQGRFLSVDPGNAGASLGTPGSWNGYAYVGNNPLAFLDPSGLCSVGANGQLQDDPGAPCVNGTSINVSAGGDSSINMTAPPGTCLSFVLDGVEQGNNCGSGVPIFTVMVMTPPQPPVSKTPLLNAGALGSCTRGSGSGSSGAQPPSWTTMLANVWKFGLSPGNNPAMQAAKQATRQIRPSAPPRLIEAPELPIPGQPAIGNIGRTWTADVWKPLETYLDALAHGSTGLDIFVVVDPRVTLRPFQRKCEGGEVF